eukprot:TRINITY_DN23500_c0_g1_i1.p1 TRINITY_DN23500_c0_g1~~TRINITY_DN23500_c0_g1_i1.p1  ORF type:complete len:171 (-),score=50.82 TRINITY_DN23500_c0_g1_i1:358-870(-)
MLKYNQFSQILRLVSKQTKGPTTAFLPNQKSAKSTDFLWQSSSAEYFGEDLLSAARRSQFPQEPRVSPTKLEIENMNSLMNPYHHKLLASREFGSEKQGEGEERYIQEDEEYSTEKAEEDAEFKDEDGEKKKQDENDSDNDDNDQDGGLLMPIVELVSKLVMPQRSAGHA